MIQTLPEDLETPTGTLAALKLAVAVSHFPNDIFATFLALAQTPSITEGVQSLTSSKRFHGLEKWSETEPEIQVAQKTPYSVAR